MPINLVFQTFFVLCVHMNNVCIWEVGPGRALGDIGPRLWRVKASPG